MYIANDAGRYDLLRLFVANAKAQKPTQVFVTGRLFTNDAATNASSLIGLYMEVQSSGDILLETPK